MEWNRQNVKYLLLVFCGGVAFYCALQNLGTVFAALGWLLGVLWPFLLGGAIAFILNVPMRAIERHLFAKNRRMNRARRPLALVLTLAAVIGLHNIPEGMSIAAPLLTGGSRPAGAVGVAALSGLPTILGALLGYTAGVMNPVMLSVSLGFAAGAMLYVVFGELLPEAEQLWQNRLSGVSTLLGMLLGMALIFLGAH